MGDCKSGEYLPLHTAKRDLDPRLADWEEGVEVHKIVSAEIDSSPDCATPDSIRQGTREQQANAECDERPSEGEVSSPATPQHRCCKRQNGYRDYGMDETPADSVKQRLCGDGCYRVWISHFSSHRTRLLTRGERASRRGQRVGSAIIDCLECFWLHEQQPRHRSGRP